MPYLTVTQFIQQAGGAFAGADPQVLESACGWASRTADMYLSKRYQLPLVTYEEDLTYLCFALAQWKIATQLGFRPGSGQNEVVRMQYDDAIKQLTQISTGDLTINCVDSTPDVDEEGSLATSGEKLNFQDVVGSGCRRRTGWDCW